MRQISISNGCRSFRSLDSGLRPNATEISLLAPPNFPFGEVHDSSAISFMLILRILFSPNEQLETRTAYSKPCNTKEGISRASKWIVGIRVLLTRPLFGDDIP